VHPSALGQRIATDLVLETLARAVRDRCQHQPYAEHTLPTTGWLADPTMLRARANFIMVNDTECPLKICNKLIPKRHAPGFSYMDEVKLANSQKRGWVSTNPKGNEVIVFDLNLPKRPCYVVHLAVLRSYNGMGLFEVTVKDADTGVQTSVNLDGLWKPRISVWSDNAIVTDNMTNACTGPCSVTVRTKPQVPGRNGNKVKILTLSARECSKPNGRGE
jgi:hypothetical protein